MGLITYEDKSNSLPITNVRRIYRDIDANEVKNVVNENFGLLTSREFDREWSTELLFDKNEIAYEEHELTGDIEYTVADGGHISGQFCSVVQEIITDGTHQVTFTGFKYVSGDIQSGDTPGAGTYQVFFLYYNGIATAMWSTPTSESANLTPLIAPANFAMVPGAGDPETELDATWDAVANAEELVIELSASGTSGPWVLPITLAASATSYTRTGLTEGTTYHQRIRAIGDLVVFSNSPYSVAAGTTEDAADVGAPTFIFYPADAATDIAVNDVVTITASAPIRDNDGTTVITDANLSDYIVVKVDNGAGADIPYTATIDGTKTIITITPNIVWPTTDQVFIQISGVEGSINSVHAATDDATFTTSAFTIMNNNILDFGDILDTIFSANDTNFDLKFTAKDLILSGSSALVFRKYETAQRAILATQINASFVFKWYGGPEPSVPIREITWANVLTAGEHDYEIEYRGAVDTNNGLDRVTLKIDGVTQGSKSLTTATLSWPFSIQNTTAHLKAGPSIGQVKDIIITSALDTVTELNIPIVRTGLDISGNARHGTWV